MSAEALLLLLLVGLAWFWWDGLLKREIAMRVARSVCERAGVQLLDETVAMRRMSLRRDASQQARIYREFAFEYSTVGDDRQAGRVYMLGERVIRPALVRVDK